MISNKSFREYLQSMYSGHKRDSFTDQYAPNYHYSIEHYDEHDAVHDQRDLNSWLTPEEDNDYRQFSQNIGAEENGRITPEYISSIINRQIYNEVFRPIGNTINIGSTFEIFNHTTDELAKALYHLNELHNLGFDVGLFDILRINIEKELIIREHGDDDNYFRVS